MRYLQPQHTLLARIFSLGYFMFFVLLFFYSKMKQPSHYQKGDIQMKKWIVVLFALLPSLVMAAGGNVHLDKAENDLTDQASLHKMVLSYS